MNFIAITVTIFALGIAFAVLTFLVKAPVIFVLISFLPMLPTLATLVVELVGLAEFSRMFDLRARPIDYIKLVLGAMPYQLLLAYAALRASLREFRGRRDWEKTDHVGAHRTDLPAFGLEGGRVR